MKPMNCWQTFIVLINALFAGYQDFNGVMQPGALVPNLSP